MFVGVWNASFYARECNFLCLHSFVLANVLLDKVHFFFFFCELILCASKYCPTGSNEVWFFFHLKPMSPLRSLQFLKQSLIIHTLCLSYKIVPALVWHHIPITSWLNVFNFYFHVSCGQNGEKRPVVTVQILLFLDPCTSGFAWYSF